MAQKNHATSLDKKKLCNLSGQKKIMQPLRTKKIIEPRWEKNTLFWDIKNHASSQEKKKIMQPLRTKRNHATSTQGRRTLRTSPWMSDQRGGGDAFILERLPIFRAPREGDGCSTPVHGQVTLHTSPWTQKNCIGRGQSQSGNTDIATTRKNGP